jgi:hypothetical protein
MLALRLIDANDYIVSEDASRSDAYGLASDLAVERHGDHSRPRRSATPRRSAMPRHTFKAAWLARSTT